MREILFRGKRKDNGEWVEGGYVGKTCKTILPEAEASAQIIDNDLFWHEVILGTVGQYTGLIDRNGVKIFEGDIVKNHKGDIGIIQWFTEHSAFMIFCTNQNKIYFLYDNDFSEIEIIGNIHDNPELLKGAEIE